MNPGSEIHPNEVLEFLLAIGARSQRQGNLARLHEICRKQHSEGSRDFSLPTIGRLCEKQGVMRSRTLYNAASKDYVTLINAWATYAGPSTPKPPKMLASHDYLVRIEDPAIRSIMQAIIAERDKLKAQLNTLKSNSHVIVDRRPLGASVVTKPGTDPLTVLVMNAQLTASERTALQKAISPEFLEHQGWREGSHGDILNDRGRTLFDMGFARAIRKVLGD